jgi:hypothetical protein
MSCCSDVRALPFSRRRVARPAVPGQPFPAKERAPGAREDDPGTMSFRESTSLSFPAPSHGAGHFLFRQKVAKDHGARGGGRTYVVFVRLPCDARRTAAAPNSHIHVLGHAALAPPFGCASRRRQRRRLSLRRPAIHGLRDCGFWRHRLVVSCAHEARLRGPSDAASGRRSSPKDGAQDVRQFAAGTGMCRRRTPAAVSEPAAQGCAKGASAGWPSLWCLSLGHARERHPRAREARGRRQGCRGLRINESIVSCVRNQDIDVRTRALVVPPPRGGLPEGAGRFATERRGVAQ